MTLSMDKMKKKRSNEQVENALTNLIRYHKGYCMEISDGWLGFSHSFSFLSIETLMMRTFFMNLSLVLEKYSQESNSQAGVA